MDDPTQQDPSLPPGASATNETPGDQPPLPAGVDDMSSVTNSAASEPVPGGGGARDDDDDLDDEDDDLDGDDDTLDPAVHEAMTENLLARVAEMRQRWAMLEHERYELRRVLGRVERERDAYRAEHERALRRAEAAELQLAEVQARIAALEDSLQQRRRGRGGSAKLPGSRHDVGQDFK